MVVVGQMPSTSRDMKQIGVSWCLHSDATYHAWWWSHNLITWRTYDHMHACRFTDLVQNCSSFCWRFKGPSLLIGWVCFTILHTLCQQMYYRYFVEIVVYELSFFHHSYSLRSKNPVQGMLIKTGLLHALRPTCFEQGARNGYGLSEQDFKVVSMCSEGDQLQMIETAGLFTKTWEKPAGSPRLYSAMQ